MSYKMPVVHHQQLGDEHQKDQPTLCHILREGRGPLWAVGDCFSSEALCSVPSGGTGGQSAGDGGPWVPYPPSLWGS
jgi:hypothetical protein